MPATHFLVRIGKSEQNWSKCLAHMTFGFDEKTPNMKALKAAISTHSAVVWFLAPKQPGKPCGRIVALCVPNEIHRRDNEDLTDAEIGWNPTGSNTLPGVVHDYVHRMSLDGILLLKESDDLSTNVIIKKRGGKPLSQSGMHLVQGGRFHRYMNKMYRRKTRGLRAMSTSCRQR